MVGELFRVAAEYGPWGVAALVSVLAVRSGPGRALGRLLIRVTDGVGRISDAEMRRRYEQYLRAKGLSDEEIYRLLDSRRDGPPELPPPEPDGPKPPDPAPRLGA